MAQATWRTHVEAITAYWQVCILLLDGVHFSSTYIFGSNDARLILKGNAVVCSLGDQVCILFASSVEEVELLAPAAVALGLCAVVAGWLVLVALEMPLSTCQATCARSLWLTV